jgi:phage terminase large subunit
MPFIRTTAINKILKMKRFVRGIQGGTSAGKTYAIIPILVDIAAKNPFSEISIVAESIPHLKRGAMKDFKKIMFETGRWFDDRWNATDFKYNFANGSQIEFFSADNDAKLRGARRDWLYMNECNNMTFHSYTELASRTKQGVFLDWNPTNPFWFHDELINDPDVDFIIINYQDNEACPESALNFILKAKEKADNGSAFWANWFRVYGLGEIGSLDGVVFQNWQQCERIPAESEFISYGLDWGFTNDPTALVEVYRYDGKIYINELLYQTKLTNSEIVNHLKQLGVNSSRCIVADSAEPKSIAELTNAGFYVEAARKGPDSIKASIDRLQGYDLRVTKNSLNLIKELRQYRWAKDREGRSLNAPEDILNHAIDAVRYVGLNKLSQFEAIGEYSFADDDY